MNETNGSALKTSLRHSPLKDGNVVVDLGSGTRYFALKLSPIVGRHGSVVAVDILILTEPLLFLSIRAFLRNQGNIDTRHGQPDNPRLQTGSADAVLIANTHYELTQPKPILDHVFQSLKPGERLVILDHALRSADPGCAAEPMSVQRCRNHAPVASQTMQGIHEEQFQRSVATVPREAVDITPKLE